MKIVTILLIVLGLAVAIVPQFYTCQAHGFDIELKPGVHIPMVCLWTAHAEGVVGMMLVVAGILLAFLRSREVGIALSVMAIFLGFAAVVLPMGLAGKHAFLFSIGICMNPDMPCVVVMKPLLTILGPLVMLTGIGGLLLNVVRLKPTA